MATFPAPTFAAAHGACLGVGLGLLIATDVVYVAGDAKIGSPFAALGATLDSGGHALFVERLGAHATLDLIYTGRLMSGAEAVRAGLFSRAFPAEEVHNAATSAARTAAAGPTQAFRASKRIVGAIRDERLGLWEAMALENRAQAALAATEDYREGFAAFQAKRPPPPSRGGGQEDTKFRGPTGGLRTQSRVVVPPDDGGRPGNARTVPARPSSSRPS